GRCARRHRAGAGPVRPQRCLRRECRARRRGDRGVPRPQSHPPHAERGAAMSSEVIAPEPRGARRGEPLPEALLDEAERMSREEVEALQLTRLRTALRHAYDNVELYRKKFDAACVGPDDCHTLADLVRFPFTTKADLR